MFRNNPPVEREFPHLIAIADERLTGRQKSILFFVSQNTQTHTASSLARKLEKELNCSRTAVWQNMNSLKRCRLVDFGTRENAGMPVALTHAGMAVAQGICNGGSHELR